jgi:phage terminase large subunit-like protein
MGYQEMFRVEEHLWHKNQGKHDAQAMGVPYKDGIRNIIFLTFSPDIKEEWVIWGK